jgi:hypothetical protein
LGLLAQLANLTLQGGDLVAQAAYLFLQGSHPGGVGTIANLLFQGGDAALEGDRILRCSGGRWGLAQALDLLLQGSDAGLQFSRGGACRLGRLGWLSRSLGQPLDLLLEGRESLLEGRSPLAGLDGPFDLGLEFGQLTGLILAGSLEGRKTLLELLNLGSHFLRTPLDGQAALGPGGLEAVGLVEAEENEGCLVAGQVLVAPKSAIRKTLYQTALYGKLYGLAGPVPSRDIPELGLCVGKHAEECSQHKGGNG